MTDGFSEDGDVLRRWIELLRRRRRWALLVFTGLVALAAAVVFLSRPVYRAEARLRLGEPPPSSGVSPNAGIVSFLRLGGDPFANDLELLGSRSLAESLVREVSLSVRLVAPRGIYRDSVFTAVSVEDSTVEATYEVTWVEPDRVEIRRTAPRDSTIGAFSTGVPVSFGGVHATFRARGAWGPERVQVRTVPFGEAVRPVPGRLTLTRTRREANVLMVSYADPDPGVAQAAVEVALSSFLVLRAELMQRESGETVDSLRTVAAATERELVDAEEAIEALQRTTAMVAPEAQAEALIERYESGLAALESARAELDALDTQLARVADASDRVRAWTTLVAHPRFLENQTVGELLARLTELEGQRAELATRRTDRSRELRAVDEQVDQLDGALRTLAGEFRGALEEQVTDLEGRVDEMDALIARIPRQALELARLQRTARVLTELVVITEQRLRQEELRQALSFSNVQVIDPPKLRYRPIWPRKKLGLAVGLLIAFASALFAAVVAERADPTVRTEAQIRSLTGGPVLASALDRSPAAEMSARDVDSLRLGAELASSNGRLTVAAVGGELDPARVAAALLQAGVAPEILDLRLEGFDAGAAGPVVLLARPGRTRRAHLARAARLVREAGGTVVGTIVVGREGAEVKAVWG